jgi:hypothetical protein
MLTGKFLEFDQFVQSREGVDAGSGWVLLCGQEIVAHDKLCVRPFHEGRLAGAVQVPDEGDEVGGGEQGGDSLSPGTAPSRGAGKGLGVSRKRGGGCTSGALATWMWQRRRGRLRPRSREATRSRASESPWPGEDRDIRTAQPDEEVEFPHVLFRSSDSSRPQAAS